MTIRNHLFLFLLVFSLLGLVSIPATADNTTVTTTATTPVPTVTTVPTTVPTTTPTTVATTVTTATTTVASSVPVPIFSASPVSGTAPLTVQFTDSSTGYPTIWTWNFGDGNSSTLENPTNTFASSGNYTITLTVADSAGDSNSTVQTDLITVDANTTSSGDVPVPIFEASPASGTAPLDVLFIDESTGDPTSWSWDFGDGNTSSEEEPLHTYVSEGTYTVSLTATNDYGSNETVLTDYVSINNETLAASSDLGTASAASTDSGSAVSDSPDSGDASGSGGAGLSSSDFSASAAPVTVTATLPSVAFDASPRSGSAPLAVEFGSDAGGDPVGWSWDFGDGGTSTEKNPSYTYTSPGTYDVILTCDYADGKRTSMESGYITVSGGSSSSQSALPGGLAVIATCIAALVFLTYRGRRGGS